MDLEKAFDRVPREVIRWAMCKLGVEEWLVSAVMSMYTGAKTVVRTVYGNSSGLEVKVGMHQGSALSPLLFVIVMEAILLLLLLLLLLLSAFIKCTFVDATNALYLENVEWSYPGSCCMLMTWLRQLKLRKDLIKRLNEWKNNVENRGMRVNMNKTKVMISGERQKSLQKAARWPCGACGRGVGSNSIQCTSCHK